MHRAVEQARVAPINGFPRVADKIASDPDKTTTIFRRFDRLSARNLLFQEAEIAELEAQLDKLDSNDLIAADGTVIECHSDWRKFEKYATERNGQDEQANPKQAARFELALKIKEKLRDYRKFSIQELPSSEKVLELNIVDEALVAHQTLLNSRPPASTTINAMRNWYLGGDSRKMEPRPQLWGGSAKMFDDPNDLVALRVLTDQDRLSEFILNYFGGFFNGEFSDEGSAYISGRSLERCVAIISSVLSAGLLFGSITSLYLVHNPPALLGMLGGWTILFAVCVGFLTNAKRDQIFAATAAYAAVLVVFISGNLGGAPTPVPNSVELGTWNCTQI
ncbi:hypothetical protein F5884DRAFT_853049 [Xylogone sp. PMI_703]|nr:hypothetical protein F5884DRAFT_853049 [Xylogone sp. PMI_703]